MARDRKRQCEGYLLHTIEMAIRETMKTTPAAAEPAIKGSCSLSSDLKSSRLHKMKNRQAAAEKVPSKTYLHLVKDVLMERGGCNEAGELKKNKPIERQKIVEREGSGVFFISRKSKMIPKGFFFQLMSTGGK